MLGGIRDRVPGLAGPLDGRLALGTYSGAVLCVGGIYENLLLNGGLLHGTSSEGVMDSVSCITSDELRSHHPILPTEVNR